MHIYRTPSYYSYQHPKKISDDNNYQTEEENYFEDDIQQELDFSKKHYESTFRDEELYSPYEDHLDELYKKYDSYDLPIVRSTNKYRIAEQTNIPYSLDTDYPKIKMHADSKYIPEEKVIEWFQLNGCKHGLINEMFEDGHDLNELANIIYVSQFKDENSITTVNSQMIMDGCKLLKKGYPIELVIKYLESGIVENTDQKGKTYSSALTNFMLEYPSFRDSVVLKNHYVGYKKPNFTPVIHEYKYLDQESIPAIKYLYEIIDDKKTLNKILDDCRLTNEKGEKYFSERLFEIAKKILKNNKNNWTEKDSELLDKLKSHLNENKSRSLRKEYLFRINNDLSTGKNSSTILEKYFANSKY